MNYDQLNPYTAILYISIGNLFTFYYRIDSRSLSGHAYNPIRYLNASWIVVGHLLACCLFAILKHINQKCRQGTYKE